MLKIVVSVLLVTNYVLSALAAVPSIFEIEIGKAYPAKPRSFSEEYKPRLPTRQFKAPNSGNSAVLFPEYEVIVTRKTNEVSVLTARKVFESDFLCQESMAVVQTWIADRFTGLKYSPGQHSYNSAIRNEIVSLNCVYTNDDPFPILEFEIRGKKQNAELKAAWGEYLAKER